MSDCLRGEDHGTHYADRAVFRTARVLAANRVARDTYRIRLDVPDLVGAFLPGQFVMLRLPGSGDPLLGRPMAVYRILADPAGAIELVYLVVGKMTTRLTEVKADTELELWGPLGNGFSTRPAEHLIMVAGGIGQTPFLTLAEERLGRRSFGRPPRPVEHAARVSLCYGARSAEYLALVDDFERLGVEVHLTTDDGSSGERGLVTVALERLLESSPTGSTRIATCGPVPMLRAVAALAARYDTPCEVSLESPMACGIGACFSCVAKIRGADGTWDWRRTCVEGPIFDARDVSFEEE